MTSPRKIQVFCEKGATQAFDVSKGGHVKDSTITKDDATKKKGVDCEKRLFHASKVSEGETC